MFVHRLVCYIVQIVGREVKNILLLVATINIVTLDIFTIRKVSYYWTNDSWYWDTIAFLRESFFFFAGHHSHAAVIFFFIGHDV